MLFKKIRFFLIDLFSRRYSITATGTDHHRLHETDILNYLILGGVKILAKLRCEANSDGDVIYHALVRAISGITGVEILGKVTDQMCMEQKITNSDAYVLKALEYLKPTDKILHVCINVEAKRPKLAAHFDTMKLNISKLLKIDESQVCITAQTAEGLTACGRGEGIYVLATITVERKF